MKTESLRLLVSAAGLAGFAWLLFGGGLDFMASQGVKRNNQTVAADAVAQYEMAMRNGDLVSACFRAGMASSAFLAAQQESDYRKWKTLYELCEATRDSKKANAIIGAEPVGRTGKATPSY